MSLDLGAVAPHPPILIPDIGRENLDHVADTLDAMRIQAKEVAAVDPSCIVIISPHSAHFPDEIGIKSGPELSGTFSSFGAPGIELHFENDLEMVEKIIDQASSFNVPIQKIEERYSAFVGAEELDHGTLVPLYFINREISTKLVSLGISYLSLEEHFRLGQAIAAAAADMDEPVVLVASGDLSHSLTPGAPAGYNPRGQQFDETIVDIFTKGALGEFLELSPQLIEAANECGLRPFTALAGAFAGSAVNTQVLSYEGPFGVGYLVALVRPSDKKPGDSNNADNAAINDGPTGESEPVRLARLAVEQFARQGRVPEVPDDTSPELLDRRGGVFICLKEHGDLRGCIGTIRATQDNLANEIIVNAVQAATADPRFPTVKPSELEELVYTVDILDEPQPVQDKSELDPKEYGVIVRRGPESGLLLPGIEGIDTAEEQISIAKQKAGISSKASVELHRFRVTRFV